MARDPTLKAAVNLTSQRSQGLAAYLEVSMCIDPVAVGGDGGYQNNKKY
jgi:hypothetical protein